jgi:hypothetical protein
MMAPRDTDTTPKIPKLLGLVPSIKKEKRILDKNVTGARSPKTESGISRIERKYVYVWSGYMISAMIPTTIHTWYESIP